MAKSPEEAEPELGEQKVLGSSWEPISPLKTETVRSFLELKRTSAITGSQNCNPLLFAH